MKLAEQPEMRFVISNTTEAGIAFDPACKLDDDFYICTGSFHWEELATGNLLQCSCTKHIIHTAHSNIYRCLVTYISDIEFHFRILQSVTHIVLLLFISAKDSDFFDIGIQETPKDGITERAGAAGD